jgi:endoglucanase
VGADAGERGAPRRCARAAAAIACLVALVAGCGSTAGDRGSGDLHSSNSDLAVSVRGNHLVDGAGRVIRLLGVNRSGTEYACSEGFGFTDSPHPHEPDSPAMIAAIRSWGANAVRVPLNEDCWLGTGSVKARWSGATYRRDVATYVGRLEAAGIYPILELHVVTPGASTGDPGVDGQRPMPDAAHAIPFWRQVAAKFGTDRAVVFDLYNEPNAVSWDCLRDGCEITQDSYRTDVPPYRAVGMQRLVDVVRGAGAENVILVPGVRWTSDLSFWLAFRPHDPLHRIAASFHTYQARGCWWPCWQTMIAPIARRFPVVIGEVGEADCAHTYLDSTMRLADAYGVSYLGWTWSATRPGIVSCESGPALISSYNGTPTAYGVGLRDHLRALAGKR